MQITNSINNEGNPKRDVKDIKSIILHHTGTNNDSQNYLNRTDYISCNYLIKKTGEVVRLMEDDRIAYHAGVSEWKGLDTKGNSLNWCTIGIEIESNGYDFTKEQKMSVKQLIEYLQGLYDVVAEFILRHKDIAPERKWDVGEDFYKELGTWKDYQDQFKAYIMTPEQEQAVKALEYAAKNLYNISEMQGGNKDLQDFAKETASKSREYAN